MNETIRQATLDDLQAIDSWEQELFGSDAWPTAVIAEELAHPHSYYLVVDDEGAVMGYAGLRAAPDAAVQGDIQTLAVAPAFRRRGIARRLLRLLLEEAAKRGVVDVFLEVRADNDAAMRLYVSEGFREISRRRGYYQPDGIDAVVMSCGLSSRLGAEGEPAR